MIKAKVLEHTIGIMDIIMVLLYFVYCLFCVDKTIVKGLSEYIGFSEKVSY